MERVRGAEILLLRHGQSEGNESGRFGGHGPTPLTALGKRQAAATASALAAEGGLTAIYSSDLVRAVETAMPVCQATGIAMLRTAGLRERSVGVLTGLTFAEAEQQYPAAMAALMRRDWDHCPPEGETHSAALDRAGAVLDEVLEKFPVGRTLLVAHALTIHLLMRRTLGLAGADSPRVFFQTDNCALHRLERLPDGVWMVRALNDRRHLVGVE